MSYLYVDDPAPLAAAGMGTLGAPATFTSGAELIQSTGVDLIERPSIDYMIACVDKSTAASLTFRVLWSADDATYGYGQQEAAPVSGIVVLSPVIYTVSITALIATFYLPISFYRQGGRRYVKLSIRSDAGSPTGYVTYQRRGAP